MRGTTVRVVEIVLLFAALFFCLPYIPSHEIAELPLFPGAAFATIAFTASRFLRWKPNRWIAACEACAFAAFVVILNQAVNLLYQT